jgi:hypothetical protein
VTIPLWGNFSGECKTPEVTCVNLSVLLEDKIMRLLSPINILNALAVPVALLLVLMILFSTTDYKHSSSANIVAFIFLLVLVAWMYGVINRTYDLYYDQQFVYLKGFRKNKSVPLASIKRIAHVHNMQLNYRATLIDGMRFDRYSIAFDPAIDLDDQEILLLRKKDLELFIDAVRRCNKHVVIHWKNA